MAYLKSESLAGDMKCSICIGGRGFNPTELDGNSIYELSKFEPSGLPLER